MLFKNRKSYVLNFALILPLLGGLFGASPTKASTDVTSLTDLLGGAAQMNIQPRDLKSANYMLADTPGTLDTTFDTDGKVTTDFSNNTDMSKSIVSQPNGKIVVIGYSYNGANSDFALTRYNSNGSLDTTFDSDGKVTTDFSNRDDAGMSVAIQSNGRIVVAGYTSNGFSSNHNFALARYNSNGSLDPSFDTDGKIITNFDSIYSNDHYGYSVAIQSDGKIIVAGITGGSSISYFALARYNTNGSLDTTFGTGGKMVIDFNGDGVSGGFVALQSDGKILLAGTRRYNNENDFALARYNSDGSLDTTFGSGGKIITDLGSADDYGNSIAFQPDGKIVVAGSSYEGGISYSVLARYNENGSLDTTFDSDGKVISDFNGNSVHGNAVVIQPNGKIVVGGYSWGGLDEDFALERYNLDGSLDTTFGTDGRVTTVFGGVDQAFSVALQLDGKILIAGFTSTADGTYDFALARYLGDEIHYVKWNANGANNGTSWADAYTDLQSALAVAISSDEIWVAAGTYKPTSGTDRTISFTLKNGVAIYGGFAGTETLLTQRDPATSVTVLSGDIGVQDNTSDNSYHIVVGSNTNNSAILDGFTITRGNANNPSSGAAHKGGGMYNTNGNPTLTNLIFTNNSAVWGGGIANDDLSSPILTNVTFSGNTTESDTAYPPSGGGMFNTNSSPSLVNVTFHNNSAEYGGGLFNHVSSSPALMNVTFSSNSADYGGGMLNRDPNSSPTLTHVTMSSNIASIEGGAIANAGNPVIRNSILWGNTGGEIVNINSGAPVVTYSIVQGGYPGTGNLDADPLLGPLANNGGFTQTMGLGAGSPAIDTGDDTNCPATDQRGVLRPQGAGCDIGSYEYEPTYVNIDVYIADRYQGSYNLPVQTGQRYGFGVNDGPAQVLSTNGFDIVTALRVIWQETGERTSYSEMMGLPVEQLSSEYWFPWYNNMDTNSMDQGFRIANVDVTDTTIKVMLGTTELDSFTLPAGDSVRVGYPVNNGPIQIYSEEGHDILAALRVIWQEPEGRTSYSEMMGLPVEQLSDEYWFPWYNNLDTGSMDQGFRIASVNAAGPNTIEVRVGSALQDSFSLAEGASVRVGYPVNNGPAQIVCTTCAPDEKIVTSLRVIWKETGQRTSYSETMGLPLEQLSSEYWFPWYNNMDTNAMDQGFRIANVDATDTTIRVMLGATQLDSFTLPAGDSVRVGYPVNNGPIQIFSEEGHNILAALRVIWQEPEVGRTSYSEMMGLPVEQLSDEYWFPWYNNVSPSMDQGFRISAR